MNRCMYMKQKVSTRIANIGKQRRTSQMQGSSWSLWHSWGM
uniref:Uncharacterized protein n=1 Tax=Rhizophora mucronata TaxID=61149 RepID=A0A2P2NMT3_RHIMU